MGTICVSAFALDACCTGLAAPTDHICTLRLAGRGESGWSEGAPGQYRPGSPLDSTPTPSSRCTGLMAPTDQKFTPCPAGRGEWGWLEGAPGHYWPGPPPP